MAYSAPATATEPAAGRPGGPSDIVRAAGLVLAVVAIQALFLTLFTWPVANLEPRDLPIVVAGPAPAANAVAQRLSNSQPDAFDIRIVPDAAAADQAIRDREAYGGFVVSPQPAGPQIDVHVASGASPVVAQLLTEIGQQAGRGQPVEVVDVVTADPDDPRGVGLGAGILPLVMTSVAAGILLTVLLRRRFARFLGLLGFGVLAGLVATAILQYGLDVLPGDYLRNASVVGLTALAVAGAVAGFGAILGRAGAILVAAVVFLLGNPLSGVATAPELLPQPWGEIGQLLPPGAGGTLLRSVAFFDGAAADRPAWILAIWAALSLLTLIGRAGGPKPQNA
ncbi:MAG TPA: hypothetical protein VHJ83_10740 [Micromonosporaceae bacterium]|nr:hypothetical protein [Micromonosporaceae bacterium]